MWKEPVSEMVTLNVGFERPELLDGFKWKHPEVAQYDSPSPNAKKQSNGIMTSIRAVLAVGSVC